MIIVTGASGQLGQQIVQKLVERIGAGGVGVSVRDPEKVAGLSALGVRVRRGDFEDGANLRHAFEGAAQVLLVSSNARAHGGDAIAQHRTAIEAARASGVRRVVYTSHMAASETSAFPPMHDHAATEAMLAASGLSWTALRHGFYAASGLMLMGDALSSGVIEAPEDGKVSWTAHADLAEAAAVVLSSEGRFEGPTPPLTAPEALDLSDLARIASDVLGRPVLRKTLADDELRTRMAARGAPERSAAIVLGLYLASRRGELARVDGTLEALLGRPPTRMRALLEARVAGSRASR